MRDRDRDWGGGVLSRVAAFTYTLLMVEIMVVVASLPTLVLLALLLPLDRSAGNPLLGGLAVLPVGPAVSAALYALQHRTSDLTQLRPVALFWHGYRLNAVGALAVWAIGVGWLAVASLGILGGPAAGMPRLWTGLLLVVVLLALVWTTNALLITSLFAFRVRDVARLAWYMIGRRPFVALGLAGVLLATLLLAAATSELVVALVAAALVLALLTTARPMTDLIRADFTA